MYFYVLVCAFVTTAFAMDLRYSGCNFEGQTYNDGEFINGANDPCNNCRCENGEVICYRTICASLPCIKEERYVPKGKCCPVCKEKDETDDKEKEDSEEEKEEKINSSENGNETGGGNIDCKNVVCPVLPCSLEESVVLEGQCCPVCDESMNSGETEDGNESSEEEIGNDLGATSEEDEDVGIDKSLGAASEENVGIGNDLGATSEENVGIVPDNLGNENESTETDGINDVIDNLVDIIEEIFEN